MKAIVRRLAMGAMKVLPAAALLLAVSSANSVCFFLSHQPDVPEGIEKFQKRR